ncbi:hypothetical protein D9757_012996 [Collybiopsis confluens]|uniref:Uncharacterized protein n=1 Tax=Collybiopsis confluens TaxID=2823264 RepID=A0A8H5GIT7_9AGAR|nr:hypothetical protein D9757_012996 [Collybiopsis confluens]
MAAVEDGISAEERTRDRGHVTITSRGSGSYPTPKLLLLPLPLCRAIPSYPNSNTSIFGSDLPIVSSNVINAQNGGEDGDGDYDRQRGM